MRITRTASALIGTALCGSLALGVVGIATAADRSPARPAASARAADPVTGLMKQVEALKPLSEVISAVTETTRTTLGGKTDAAALGDLRKQVDQATEELMKAVSNAAPAEDASAPASAMEAHPDTAPLEPAAPDAPVGDDAHGLALGEQTAKTSTPEELQTSVDRLKKSVDAMVSVGSDPVRLIPAANAVMRDLTAVVMGSLATSGMAVSAASGNPAGTAPQQQPAIPAIPAEPAAPAMPALPLDQR